MAGAGGEAPLPPKPELLFTVKYGAHGLADTALSKQANPENSIYTTDTTNTAFSHPVCRPHACITITYEIPCKGRMNYM